MMPSSRLLALRLIQRRFAALKGQTRLLKHPLPLLSTSPFSTAVQSLEPPVPLSVPSSKTPLQGVDEFLEKLPVAAAWNHGKEGKAYDKSLWDPSFCRQISEQYESYLQQLVQDSNSTTTNTTTTSRSSTTAHQLLLSEDNVCWAFTTLTKSRYTPPTLAQKVRDWEKMLGTLQQTPLTDAVTLRLLLANGKAGNVGRVLSLLQLRLTSKPERREYTAAIQSLQAAHWSQRYGNRNVLTLLDHRKYKLEDPTRWLDAILVNMQQRGMSLDIELANQMLDCFAAGPTGKAVHHFYRIHRRRRRVVSVINDDLKDDEADDDNNYYYKDENVATMEEEWNEDDSDTTATNSQQQQHNEEERFQVQLRYHPQAPPHYKVPSRASTSGQLDRERDPEFSYPLAAAFSFAESLQHGACGHAPIQLNSASYTALIKACVHRGALHRAMMELLPQQQELVAVQLAANTATAPKTINDNDDEQQQQQREQQYAQHKLLQSYNLLLAGLARVGDIAKAQELYAQLLAAELHPDAWTVRAVVDGLVNVGDLSGAVTAVQDFFNQHGTLPPYTTHLKLLEFALASDQVYEAKRYVFFLQQLWHWKPNQYHSVELKKLMKATQANPQLQKEALQKLFAYFGEELVEEDFL